MSHDASHGTSRLNDVSQVLSILKDTSWTLSRAVLTLENLKMTRVMLPPHIAGGINFYEQVRSFEISLIVGALKCAGGRQRRAASLLGLNATTLNAKIKAYNIDWRNIA